MSLLFIGKKLLEEDESKAMIEPAKATSSEKNGFDELNRHEKHLEKNHFA